MSDDIDPRVTPALHPTCVEAIDGYNETTAPVLAPTQTAFSAAYIRIGEVHDAREKARTNPTWNEAQQVIATDDFAQKQFAAIARGFDSARANLVRGIEHIENELSAPVTAKASQGVAAEIRAHTKTLSLTQRVSFLRQAIQNGDDVTATAVLGAPAYLSGLDPEIQALLLRDWHVRTSPEKAQRLKAMQGARDLIEERSGLVFKQLAKAVGAPPHKAQALRAAKTAAEKAFVMRDA